MAHYTPDSDAEVRRRFLGKLRRTLSELRPEIVEYLSIEDVAPRERLQLVSHELESKGDTLLVVVDNFDDVLASPGITRELLDDMRMAASRPTLRFVCGSRRPLRELCGADESHPSEFWQIFHDAPVVVGCFSPTGWQDLFVPFEEIGVEVVPEARDEAVRWTGGVPVLAAAFLQGLYDGAEPGMKVSVEHASRTGERMLDERRELLSALWTDLSAEMKTDLADLALRELRVSQVPEGRLRELESRGLVRRAGKKLQFACRLFERFVRREAPEVGSLQRLFGDPEQFERNIRTLLEVRLAQVPMIDSALHGYVQHAVRHLDPDPRHSAVWFRNIADRALDLVWKQELGDGVTLPATWLEEWRRAGLRSMPDDGHGRLPAERGRQVRVLRLATGTGVRGMTIRRVSRYVSRPTALLIEHLQRAGNLGQHQGDDVMRPFAVSLCVTAIALCANLATDLGAGETGS
jgi:hypothetical protein